MVNEVPGAGPKLVPSHTPIINKQLLNQRLSALLENYSIRSVEDKTTQIKDLILQGADVNTQDEYGSTALHFATANGVKELVEFLIAKGVDVNICRNAGDNPLLSAIAGKHREHRAIAKLLIEKGIDPNTKNLWGYTPLQWAGAEGDKEFVELLLIHQADPNAKDILGRSCLQYAKNQEITELLKEHGAIE